MKGDGKATIGILAVQGDYEAHGKVLERMGVEYRYVVRAADLDGIDGLIIPGGESSTMLKFLEAEGLRGALENFAKEGGALFGTCAGVILLAKEVKNPAQASLGLADVTVVRNAYGRQLSSHVAQGPSKLSEQPLEMVFIRAPIIERTGEGVEVLAEYQGRPVLVRDGKVLAATFHPELTDDTSVHEAFLRMIGNGVKASVGK
ncbi:MAG: pyridoxal 5'-phosphate synthase glutaminase subunit PdxT [Candidatus Acidiferrales bacterium]